MLASGLVRLQRRLPLDQRFLQLLLAQRQARLRHPSNGERRFHQFAIHLAVPYVCLSGVSRCFKPKASPFPYGVDAECSLPQEVLLGSNVFE
jgi:hypothetical protein